MSMWFSRREERRVCNGPLIPTGEDYQILSSGDVDGGSLWV